MRSNHVRQLFFSTIIFLLSSQGCTSISNAPTTEEIPATQTRSLSIIATNTLRPTIANIPSRTPTITTPAVPEGIFALIFYPPLIMNYDPTIWVDLSEYTNKERMVNYLQSTLWETCKIGVQGPTVFNIPYEFLKVTLGKIRYIVVTIQEPNRGITSARYIEDQSLTGYDYGPGLPIPVVSAQTDEWITCKEQAEIILSTLHSP